MDKKSVGGTGLGALTLIFITLKLVGVIDWSWFWVLSPLLIEIILVVLVVLFALWLRR